MKLSLSILHFCLPLKNPYKLSFIELFSFETFYIILEGRGRIGIGEITPLPGYSHETVESVIKETRMILMKLKNGTGYKEVIHEIYRRSPFVASGMACAYETWLKGQDVCFFSPISEPIPLAGFCGGDNAEKSAERARDLVMEGFRTLKMKVGVLTPLEDATRIRAVSKEIPSDCNIRLDANQAYSMKSALAFCRMIDDIDAVELIEQPFQRDQWMMNEKLAEQVRIPIMLDESIWDKNDIQRASDCGAKLVKFKLCKHPGMESSKKLAKRAFSLGLGIVYGNGVQTAVGNHLEAILYQEMGIETASESNGFLKPIESPILHKLIVNKGMLLDNGIKSIDELYQKGTLEGKVSFFLTESSDLK
jgi:o-succinylbenzoate synthase